MIGNMENTVMDTYEKENTYLACGEQGEHLLDGLPKGALA